MKTTNEVHAHILQKAAENADFRKRLIADPKGVIEGEIGRELPDDALVFVQESVATAQQQVSSTDAPLTAEELEQVMGGGAGCPRGYTEQWGICTEDRPHGRGPL